MSYDYNFDVRSYDKVVCSTLAQRCYEPSERHKGVAFETKKVMGIPMLTPNGLAEVYAKEHGRDDRQMDFVGFLDSEMGMEQAVEADADALARSAWRGGVGLRRGVERK